MPEKLIKETLIHEMIHLWQVSSVKQERYEVCTHEIAHDRVFKGKMATINLMLKYKDQVNPEKHGQESWISIRLPNSKQ